jgi:phage-related baseplate assembly protein
MEGINLALLPPLDVVKQLTHEEIVQAVVSAARLENAAPSDPAYRIALAGAYREILVRQDANEQARGVMLAFATGGELDHIGATYYKHPDGSPVVRLDGEKDADYQARLQLSPEGVSVAGPDGAYEFHAQSAHASVKNAKVSSPNPVEVEVTVLGYEGDGVLSADTLALVDAYLWPRRPLTDQVSVKAATIKRFDVTAVLTLKQGPDAELARQAAEQAAAIYLELKRLIGGRVVASGLHAALMVEGVDEVILTGWDDVLCTDIEAPYCESLSVWIGGYV